MNSKFWRFVVVLQSIVHGMHCVCGKCTGLPFSGGSICIHTDFSVFRNTVMSVFGTKYAVNELMKLFHVPHIKDMYKTWLLFLEQLREIIPFLHHSLYKACESITKFLEEQVRLIDYAEDQIRMSTKHTKLYLNKKKPRPHTNYSSLLSLPPGFKPPPGLAHPHTLMHLFKTQ